MEQNSDLLADASPKTSSLGNVPILELGDFNFQVERSTVLAHLITSGRWSDIGQTCPTLGRNGPSTDI